MNWWQWILVVISAIVGLVTLLFAVAFIGHILEGIAAWASNQIAVDKERERKAGKE